MHVSNILSCKVPKIMRLMTLFRHNILREQTSLYWYCVHSVAMFTTVYSPADTGGSETSHTVPEEGRMVRNQGLPVQGLPRPLVGAQPTIQECPCDQATGEKKENAYVSLLDVDLHIVSIASCNIYEILKE